MQENSNGWIHEKVINFEMTFLAGLLKNLYPNKHLKSIIIVNNGNVGIGGNYVFIHNTGMVLV